VSTEKVKESVPLKGDESRSKFNLGGRGRMEKKKKTATQKAGVKKAKKKKYADSPII